MKIFDYYTVVTTSGRIVYRAQTASQAKRLAELDGYDVLEVEVD